MIGRFRAVIFTPHHLSLVKDGPENRRKFLDSALCQLNSVYASEVAKYSKILKQRNALLKQIFKQKCNKDCLDIWDKKLVKIGSKILKRRLNYLLELSLKSTDIYSEISSGKENLKINYISSVSKSVNLKEICEEEIKEHFWNKLKNSENFDITQGFTSVGPHKDDIEITLQDLSLKKFGSQGQQRSVVLALKLAEAAIVKHHVGELPVVLLDDIISELDDFRISYIINKLKNYQAFITGCSKETTKYFRNTNIFYIQNGGYIKNTT